MPISRILKDTKASAEEVERLKQAFAFTLKSMCLVDRNDPVCEIVARKVVQIATDGVQDPKDIARRATRELGVSTL
jgi:hypothetical protein